MARYGMIIDLRTCTGCRACQAACAMENQTPYWAQKYRTHVEDETTGQFPDVKRVLMPHLCMQCDKAPCVTVCPTGATHKTAEGIIVVDRKLCIDCKYCIAACPYGARFEYTKADESKAQAIFGEAPAAPFVDKCNFCEQRLKVGLEPACVATCLAGARIFGDLDDPTSKVSQLASSGPAVPVAPEAGTQPKVLYVENKVQETSVLPVSVTSAGLAQVRQMGQTVGSLGVGALVVGALGVSVFARRSADEHFAEVASELAQEDGQASKKEEGS